MASSNRKRPSPSSSEASRASDDDVPQGIASQLLDMIRMRQKLQRSSGDVSEGVPCPPPQYGISFSAPRNRGDAEKGAHATSDSPSHDSSSIHGFQSQGGPRGVMHRDFGEFVDKYQEQDILNPSFSNGLQNVSGAWQSNCQTNVGGFHCTGQVREDPFSCDFNYEDEPNTSKFPFSIPPGDMKHVSPEPLDVETEQLLREITNLPNVASCLTEFDSTSSLFQENTQSKVGADDFDDHFQHLVFSDGLQSRGNFLLVKDYQVVNASAPAASTCSSNFVGGPYIHSKDESPFGVGGASFSVDNGLAYQQFAMANNVLPPESPNISTISPTGSAIEFGNSDCSYNSQNPATAFNYTKKVDDTCEVSPHSNGCFHGNLAQEHVHRNRDLEFSSSMLTRNQRLINALNLSNSETNLAVSSSVYPNVSFQCSSSAISSAQFSNSIVSTSQPPISGVLPPRYSTPSSVSNLRPSMPSALNMRKNGLAGFSIATYSTVQPRSVDQNGKVDSISSRGTDPSIAPSSKFSQRDVSSCSIGVSASCPCILSCSTPGILNPCVAAPKSNVTSFSKAALNSSDVCHTNMGTPQSDAKSNQSMSLLSQFQALNKINMSDCGQPENGDEGRIPFSFTSRPAMHHLENLLMHCADTIERGDLHAAHDMMQALNAMSSPHGSAMQRMGYYFLEGLAARIIGTGSAIYRALQSRSGAKPGPSSKDLMKAMLAFLECCPYVTFSHTAANNTIFEAVEGHSHIHIIDFGITHGTQWPTMIELLAKRSNNPPHLRITRVDAANSGLKPSSIEETGRRLSMFAKSMGVPFEFCTLTEEVENLTLEKFELRPKEVLAVSCVLRLHQVVDDSVESIQKSTLDSTLRMIHDLSPKIVTLAEEHSDHNLPIFKQRFKSAVDYFSSLFESLEASFAWNSNERVLIEERILGRKIINIVACEGKERIERHIPHDIWHMRMVDAGFQPMHFSNDVIDSLHALLKRYSEGYGVELSSYTAMLTWRQKKLIAASAWKC